MPHSNNAPRDAEDFAHDIEALEQVIADWQRAEITSENVENLHKDIDFASRIKKEADASHKAIKEPFLEGGRRVDDRFRPVRNAAEDGMKALKKLLGAYLAEEQRKRDEEARKKREEAERLAREAEALKDDAILGADAQAAAEQKALEAKRAERHVETSASSVVDGARTIGLRTYHEADVTDAQAMVMHYANHPDVIAAALKCAKADIRTSKGSCAIPGVTVREEKRAA